MTYENYRLIFIIAAVAAGIMLAVSIALFVVLRISSVIGYLTGATAKKAIADIKRKNAGEGGSTGTFRGGLTSGKKSAPAKKQKAPSSAKGKTPKNDKASAKAETPVEETGLLQRESAGGSIQYEAPQYGEDQGTAVLQPRQTEPSDYSSYEPETAYQPEEAPVYQKMPAYREEPVYQQEPVYREEPVYQEAQAEYTAAAEYTQTAVEVEYEDDTPEYRPAGETAVLTRNPEPALEPEETGATAVLSREPEAALEPEETGATAVLTREPRQQTFVQAGETMILDRRSVPAYATGETMVLNRAAMNPEPASAFRTEEEILFIHTDEVIR